MIDVDIWQQHGLGSACKCEAVLCCRVRWPAMHSGGAEGSAKGEV